MQPGQHQRGGDPRQQAQPDRSGHRRERRREERRRQHLALEADVEDPRALREEPGEAGQQQRRGQPHGAVENLDDGQEIHHAAPPPAPGQEQLLQRHPHHVVERPGEQDHQRLDHHDQLARDRGPERQLGAALVEKAEEDRRQEHPERVAAAHQRHRDADEAGALDGVQHQPLGLAHHVVDRHQPASPPEISIAIMVIRAGEMPA